MSNFIMMTGIPGSGKSILAKELSLKYDAKIHSSDVVRKELYGDESIQGEKEEVFNTLHKRIKDELARGQPVIYDACNISYKRRKSFLEEIKRWNPHSVCVCVVKPYDECVQDNCNRERIVPEEIIKNMIKSFWIPQYYEGWNEIKLIYTGIPNKINKTDVFNTLIDFDQETRWHSLPLGAHMMKTQTLLYNTGKIDLSKSREDQLLHVAAMWHDMGKPFVKTFFNRDGTPSRNAKYSGHAQASAYEFLVMSSADKLSQESILRICNYIQWHMYPYNLAKYGKESEKKFIELVGQEFYNRLMLLHEADKLAH